MRRRPLTELADSGWGSPVLSRAGGETNFTRSVHRSPDAWLLRFDRTAYQIEDRTGRITAYVDGHRLSPLELRGPVLAYHLHARGHVVLHASAIRVGSRIYALMGDSGAGKSTLAALAAARGAMPWADDLTPVRPDGRVARSSPRLRLVPEVWDLVRETPEWAGRTPRPLGDGRLESPRVASGAYRPRLAGLLVVERHARPDTVVRRVEGAERLVVLAKFLYLAGIVMRGLDPAPATSLLAVADAAPMHVVTVPDDLHAAREWWPAARARLT